MTPNSSNMDEQDESSSNENQQPWWVSSIYKIGIPSAIALYLIWFLATQVRADLQEMKDTVKQHQIDSLTMQDQNRKIYNVLQRICMNSSTTNQERNECF